ncbi:MAG: DUF3892 domain-containing protein [Segetibacter sp.]
MAEIEITGIRKDNGDHDNPHEAATHYRWVQHGTDKGGISARQKVVGWVDDGITAYVARVQPRANCYVNKSRSGTRFLQTKADATDQNNLLKLPEV